MRLEELVNKHYSQLNQNDIHIWRYIVKNKKSCSNLTIEELASRCNVSRTTILRFAQKLSLKGYSELKIYLKWETSEEVQMETEAIKVMCDGYNRAINDLAKRDFTGACKLIYEANRVFVYGSGDIQMAVAKQLKLMFLHGGECLYDIEGLSVDETFFSLVNPNDLVILISLNGESNKVVELAKKMNLLNVKVVSITKLKDNTLASLSDENIYITTSQVNYDSNYRSFESYTILYIVAEILFVRYGLYKKNRNLEKKTFKDFKN
ncbi:MULTISPECIES: MurR/RpiR family transcriptional regulator [Clostridium]|uniref:Transcriptional regulator n=2 Tax=Clostridium intestinale TaxID=36845 RepID=U2NS00_9CLOT|nr:MULTISPECIES: MurR/RpiR family transcriptional regulator [Clostridium]ERK31626.1 transcriptional regulator [Clostridium intestinale URNW]QLY82388.1 MurR/RpiR family transcriptional regulator [Clostridium intestinale]